MVTFRREKERTGGNGAGCFVVMCVYLVSAMFPLLCASPFLFIGIVWSAMFKWDALMELLQPPWWGALGFTSVALSFIEFLVYWIVHDSVAMVDADPIAINPINMLNFLV